MKYLQYLALCLPLIIPLNTVDAGFAVVDAFAYGTNGPNGINYNNESFTFDGNSQLIANGALSITERVFEVDALTSWFEVSIESTQGSLAGVLSSSWNSNISLQLDGIYGADEAFYYFTINGVPQLMTDNFFLGIGAHPFDNIVQDVAFYRPSGTIPGQEFSNPKIYGLFSSPYTFLMDSLNVDETQINGIRMGGRITAVPEPTTLSLMAVGSIVIAGRYRRRK